MEDAVTVVMLEKRGEAVGITFPNDVRVRMGLEAGQKLALVETADGLKLVTQTSALERQIQLAHEVLREEADTLRELAKR